MHERRGGRGELGSEPRQRLAARLQRRLDVSIAVLFILPSLPFPLVSREGRERRAEGIHALPGRVPLRIPRCLVVVVRRALLPHSCVFTGVGPKRGAKVKRRRRRHAHSCVGTLGTPVHELASVHGDVRVRPREVVPHRRPLLPPPRVRVRIRRHPLRHLRVQIR